MEVRVLGPGDAGVLASVPPGVFDHEIDPAAARAFLADPHHHLAVAVEDGAVIGFASAIDYSHPDKPRPELWIDEAGVAPGHRGRGVGRAVLRALLDAARRLGCGQAWVLTERDNHAALRLYASAGGRETQQPVMFEFDLGAPPGDGPEASSFHPLTTDPMSIAELLLPELDNEFAITRRVLERVPDGRGEWKPHEKSFPMGHLAQLVARLPGWTAMVMSRTEIDISPQDGPKFPGYTYETTATLLAEFDRNAAAAREAIARAGDDGFQVPWTLKKGGEVLATMSRYQMLRSMVLNHLVHHRAQLGVYLRLVDVPVPQMYGPTADEGK